MGAAQSSAKKEYGSDIEGIDLIDLIATKYILTQNFQDLKNLTKKEYCDKLVVLTSDIIKKYMNQRDIKYLAQRIERGNYVNELVNKKLMFLNTNKVKTDSMIEEKSEMKGGNNLLELLVGKDNVDKLTSQQKPKKKKTKTVLNDLDVENKTEKQRMCNGIAKFYISIAHLYAAIVKTLNPVYVYEDNDGKTHAMSIQNRNKIPRGVTPTLKQINLCSRRITALTPNEVEGGIQINLKNVCKMNSQKQTITMDNEWRPSQWAQGERVNTRKLGQEPGIPELQQLYWNKYDYVKGKFLDGLVIANSQAQKDYTKDLKEFYTTFTGKNDYENWNADGSKRFTDIPLIAFQDSELCGDNGSWRENYTGNGGLFTDYANQIKKMLKTTKDSEKQLMDILRKIFKVYPGTRNTGEFVSIHPELTEDKLSKIIDDARSKIVKLYLTCEKDFKDTLDIFEGIRSERTIKNAIEKKNLANELQDTLISQPPKPSTTKKIRSALMDLLN